MTSAGRNVKRLVTRNMSISGKEGDEPSSFGLFQGYEGDSRGGLQCPSLDNSLEATWSTLRSSLAIRACHTEYSYFGRCARVCFLKRIRPASYSKPRAQRNSSVMLNSSPSTPITVLDIGTEGTFFLLSRPLLLTQFSSVSTYQPGMADRLL